MKKLIAIITSTLFISFTAVAAVAADPRYPVYKCPICEVGTVIVSFSERTEQFTQTCPIDPTETDTWTVRRVYQTDQCDNCSYGETFIVSEEYLNGVCGGGYAHC